MRGLRLSARLGHVLLKGVALLFFRLETSPDAHGLAFALLSSKKRPASRVCRYRSTCRRAYNRRDCLKRAHSQPRGNVTQPNDTVSISAIIEIRAAPLQITDGSIAPRPAKFLIVRMLADEVVKAATRDELF